jgi:hypothetical protein
MELRVHTTIKNLNSTKERKYIKKNSKIYCELISGKKNSINVYYLQRRASLLGWMLLPYTSSFFPLGIFLTHYVIVE